MDQVLVNFENDLNLIKIENDICFNIKQSNHVDYMPKSVHFMRSSCFSQ